MTFVSLLSASLLLFTTAASGAVKIYGSANFSFSAGNSKVTFGCTGINNSSTENATGTLQGRWHQRLRTRQRQQSLAQTRLHLL